MEKSSGPNQAVGNGINSDLNNILRVLTALEKALGRLIRQNYFNRNQYPEIFLEF